MQRLTSRLAGKCKGISSEDIDDIWDKARPLICLALDRGSNYTIDSIYDGLKSQQMQLWVWNDVDAALVTTIQNRGSKRWCLLLAMGGAKLNEWIELLPDLEDWARGCGCQEMRIYGRIGWAKHTGYEIEYTKMSKKL